MKDIVRKTFEEVAALNFRDIMNGTSNLNRDQCGYFDPNIERSLANLSVRLV